MRKTMTPRARATGGDRHATSTRRPQTQLEATIALVFSIALAVTACGESGHGGPAEASAAWMPLTWEEFRRAVYQEPETGVFIVDGDIPVTSEKALREFYELNAPTWGPQGGDGRSTATARAPLAINRVGSIDDRWPDGVSLSYCVSTSFGGNYGAVVAAMNQAASEWNASANINFVHRSGLDGSCDASTRDVVFDVRPTRSASYIARAFFPSHSRPQRNVLINASYVPNGSPPWSLAGVLRHELGHALGFRHEHTRPEARTCFEDSDWRALTPYDAASVMHYPQCNGTNRRDLTITTLDVAGALAVYGPRFPAGPRWDTRISNQVVGDFAMWSRIPGVRAIDGDFNGDGRGDVALVGGSGWTTVPVAFGDGAGGFSVTNSGLASFPTWATSAPSIVGADFDGDGDTDIALVGGPGWTTVPIALSNRDGTFTVTHSTVPNFPTWAQFGRAVGGDFDGDGDADLALTGVSGWTTIPVAFSNRDGTFRVTNEASAAFASWTAVPGAQLVSGDFDADGDADLALAGVAGWATVPVAFSERNGTFRVTNTALAGFPQWTASPGAKLVAGDFDGDGDADLAAPGGLGWSSVPFALSTRDGRFEVANFLVRDFPGWATTARFALARRVDADASADIVLAGGDGWTTMPVLFSLISFRSSAVNNLPAPDFALWSQLPGVRAIDGDFNRDGLGDVALVGGSGWTTLPVAFGNGSGGFTVTNLSLASFPAWAQAARTILGADFDGDGDTDIALLGGQGWTTVPIAFSNGDGSFTVTNSGVQTIPSLTTNAGAQALAGDFDGDGDGDIAVYAPDNRFSAQIASSNRDGTFLLSPAVALWPTLGAQPAVGDFDGDGDDDIAFGVDPSSRGPGSGIRVAFSARNRFDTLVLPVGRDFLMAALEPGAKLVAGDFDGDGVADLAAPGGVGRRSVPLARSLPAGTSMTAREFRVDNLSWPHVFPIWAEGARFALARRMDADRSADLVLLGGAGWTTVPVLFVRP